MDDRKIMLLITLATVAVNCIFAFTGVTSSLSCTVGKVGKAIQATALAATLDH